MATNKDVLRKITTFKIETSQFIDIHFSGDPLKRFLTQNRRRSESNSQQTRRVNLTQFQL